MENRANYFLVGVFVFGVFFASLFFLAWFSGYSKEEEFAYYKIYTQESVAGLSVKAPVRLLGVEVGYVENISIDSNNEIKVCILIKVKKDSPIKEDTYAFLQLQGITGLKFIQLQGGSNTSKNLISTKNNIAVIKFKESFLSNIDKQGEHIVSLISTLDESSKQILSEQNLNNLSYILQNLANTTKILSQNSKILIQNLNNLSVKVAKMSDNISISSNKFNNSLNNIDKASGEFTNQIKLYDNTRLKINENLDLLKIFLLQCNKVLRNFEKSPSELFFKNTEKKLAPGE